MPRPRKKKVKEFHADGRVNGPPEPVQLTTKLRLVDELWGKESLPFGTTVRGEYERRINELAPIDLQKECASHGVLPKDNPVWNKTRLLELFDGYITKISLAQQKPMQMKPLSSKGRKILTENLNTLKD